MAQINEQEEQLKDQKYLDGFNTGYSLQKQLEDKSLSDKDRKIIESLAKVISKSKSDNDKLQGMKDGRKQRIIELERQRILELKAKERSRGRER